MSRDENTGNDDIEKLAPEAGGRLFGGTGAEEGPGEATSWRLASEMPMVLFYNGEQLGVMMITPGDFRDFCVGFSITQSIVKSASDIMDIRFEKIADGMIANIIVGPKAMEVARGRKRAINGGSSCGICGARTLDAVLQRPRPTRGMVASKKATLKALKAISRHQVQNRLNFSTHGAAIANEKGEIILLREDVGRHNALDKLAGAMAEKNLNGRDGFLVLTSRFSLEMAQKAAIMDFSLVSAISAPTELALKTAGSAAMQVAVLADEKLMIFENRSKLQDC